MKVSGSLIAKLSSAPQAIGKIEALGYNAAFSAEINGDPFLPLLLAAEHSKNIDLMTAISVAFARNPMTMANLAHDLNNYSQGRFILGMGSQIQAHIEKRFSMPWSKPAARMKEFVQAMRAIWASWYEGERLNFRGEFYRHTLMTPIFVPSERDYGAPRVHIAGVGPLMTEVAGEVADGMIAHGFTTAKYLREVSLPAIAKGLAISGRARSDFVISCPVMIVSGDEEQKFIANREVIKQQLAFYASTPAYRSVLEVHGWGDLQPILNGLSKEGKWHEMGEYITDEILSTFAIVAEPKDIPVQLKERYGDLIDVWMCTYAMDTDDEQAKFIGEIQAQVV